MSETGLKKSIGTVSTAGALCAVLAAITVQAPATAAPAPHNSAAARVQAELSQVTGLIPMSGTPTDDSAATHAPVTFADSKGQSVQITPNVTVTPNAYRYTDTATISEAGNASNVFVLRDARANSAVKFNLNGRKAVTDPLGGVEILNAQGVAQSRISAPWAYDATGKALPTTYTVNGDQLTQHVDTHNAKFPVIADPHYTWGIVTGTVYFNKNETNLIANHLNWVSIVAGNAPGVWGKVLSLYATYVTSKAKLAESSGKCVKLKSTGSAGSYSGSQGDGYCR